MMNGNLFQFDEYPQQDQQQQQLMNNIDTAAVGGKVISFFFLNNKMNVILDIRDYLTCDFKFSDTALNDLFYEFDVHPNEFQYYDPNTYPQQTIQTPVDLPPSYDTALLSTTQNPNIQPVINEYISSNTLNSLIEQHQAQQSIVKYSTSPPPVVSTHQINYPEVIRKPPIILHRFSILVFINFINGHVRTPIK
jgi:hypothetical protein